MSRTSHFDSLSAMFLGRTLDLSRQGNPSALPPTPLSGTASSFSSDLPPTPQSSTASPFSSPLPPTPLSGTASSVASSPRNHATIARTSGPHLKIVLYSNPEDAIKEIKKEIGRFIADYLIFREVNFTQYIEVMKKRPAPTKEDENLMFKVRSYSRVTGTLQVALPTPLHEQLHMQLKRQITTELTTCPLKWAGKLGIPATEISGRLQLYWTPKPSPGVFGKYALESDASAGPVKHCAARDKNLVILTGVSQVLEELREDARVWLRETRPNKHVLLVKACTKTRSILIENWTVRTAATGQSTPQIYQSVSISPKDGSFYVSRGPLELDLGILFPSIFVCAKGAVLEVSDQMLNDYARSVWDEVDKASANMNS